jgi:hypothetical protein
MREYSYWPTAQWAFGLYTYVCVCASMEMDPSNYGGNIIFTRYSTAALT